MKWNAIQHKKQITTLATGIAALSLIFSLTAIAAPIQLTF
jgi:hypothetical protein